MHHITDLKLVSKDIAKGLLELKTRIEAAKIPSSRLDESFTMATWNIREFGKKARSQAAIHYIAEILGQFDLIGVVELRDDLRDLRRVLEVLGPYWRAVYSDAVMDDGGNRERVAYVFDKRQIAFNGMASAAFGRRRKQGTEWMPEINWWRPPYIASFKSGNFDFVVLTTHIRWGGSAKERVPELQAIADWVSDKQALLAAGRRSWDEPDIFVMGDFNVPSRRSSLFKALTSTGLVIPTAMLKDEFGSNLARDKRYDQILHLPHYPETFTNRAGVLDFYAGDHQVLFPDLSKDQFTYQLSDHIPLWVEINTNIDALQLSEYVEGGRR